MSVLIAPSSRHASPKQRIVGSVIVVSMSSDTTCSRGLEGGQGSNGAARAMTSGGYRPTARSRAPPAGPPGGTTPSVSGYPRTPSCPRHDLDHVAILERIIVPDDHPRAGVDGADEPFSEVRMHAKR